MSEKSTSELVAQLDSCDAGRRRRALDLLAARLESRPPAEPRPEVNLHCHTFFSFNGRGWSPSRFAWEAANYGLEVAGIVDFDVLDGTSEFLEAGRLLGLKCTAGFESRVFIPEYRCREINSPHEPGVYYLSGTGFTQLPEPGSAAAATLAHMRQCAQQRNQEKAARINRHLDPVVIDYERDVLPLTPAGNATERHMLVAYEAKARDLFPDRSELIAFWSDRLDEPRESVEELLDDVPALKNVIRSRLMKHGGVGYVPPDEGSFPLFQEVVQMTRACGAVPSGCWLDGTSDGEADPVAHFSFLRERGVPTLTVIPDRNWDIADPQERDLKVRNLHAGLNAARELQMPVMVGTEMNKAGQKFVDTFAVPALEPYRADFLDAARLAWGHTLLKSTVGVGYTGAWADAHFGSERERRNSFFSRVGSLPYPQDGALRRLAAMGGAEPEPADILRVL